MRYERFILVAPFAVLAACATPRVHSHATAVCAAQPRVAALHAELRRVVVDTALVAELGRIVADTTKYAELRRTAEDPSTTAELRRLLTDTNRMAELEREVARVSACWPE
jgi:hypothetical protein